MLEMKSEKEKRLKEIQLKRREIVMNKQCLLCGGLLGGERQDAHGSADIWTITCERCGKYQIARLETKEWMAEPYIKERRYLLSALTRRRTDNEEKPFLIHDCVKTKQAFIEQIESLAPADTDIQRKVHLIVQYIAKKSQYVGFEFMLNPHMHYPIAYCKTPEEFIYYLKHIADAGLAKVNGQYIVSLSVKGWEMLATGRMENVESNQAFIAMWFDAKMNNAFMNGIKPLKEETGFEMLRIDMNQFNGKICDEIVANIRRSRFLIADVTGHRGGVYFEAGYAMGLGIPVIWTCKDNKKEKDKLHFDTRQYKYIFWKNAKDLKKQLLDRIQATIEPIQR